MPNPLTLTFSIEIECIVCIDAASYEQGLPIRSGTLWLESLPPHLHLHDKLKLICRNLLIGAFNNHGLVASDLRSPPGGHHQWTVAPAPSLQLNTALRPDGFLECDVAVSSPAMRLCDRALRRVERAATLLAIEFDSFVNESCGFHVRIGNARSDGSFRLQTLKNLCMLTARFEHQLNSLHPGHRVGNPRAKTPSAVFRGQNPWEAVERIQRCGGGGELVMLCAGGEGALDGNFAYNLVGLVEGKGKGMVEFRQHKGTLDGREMGSWIRVVGGLVEGAKRMSVGWVAELIARCGFERGFTVFDLFEKLGIEGLRGFYLGRMYVHVRPEPIWILEGGEGGRRGEVGKAGMGWRREEFGRRLERRRKVMERETGVLDG